MSTVNVALIERYLESLHATLWSSWTVTSPDQRATAAEWLFKELEAVIEFAAAEESAQRVEARQVPPDPWPVNVRSNDWPAPHDPTLQHQQQFGSAR